LVFSSEWELGIARDSCRTLLRESSIVHVTLLKQGDVLDDQEIRRAQPGGRELQWTTRPGLSDSL
jgi:hypothetical protein